MVQVLVFFGQTRTRRGAENGPGPVFDRLRTGFWMGDAKFAKMLEKCGDQAFFSISKQNRPNRLKSTKQKRTTMLSVENGQSWTNSQEHSIAEHLSPFSGFASQAFARRGKLPYFFQKKPGD